MRDASYPLDHTGPQGAVRIKWASSRWCCESAFCALELACQCGCFVRVHGTGSTAKATGCQKNIFCYLGFMLTYLFPTFLCKALAFDFVSRPRPLPPHQTQICYT